MYLSRIELDIGANTTRRAISSPQILHAAIEECFLNGIDKDRKLWRLDRLNDHLYLLLLSPKRPDFAQFYPQFCTGGVEAESRDYMPLLTQIQAGARFHFRLRANPTHSKQKENGERGKVYAHVTVEQKRNWLIQKSMNCGFMLDEDLFDVVEMDSLRFWRSSKERPVQIDTAVFEGELDVIDSGLFIQSLTQGIGRAKAYGCGLLTIARIR
ncbi:MAG: type I-E CRISPR-associated protein Cas6/Cse3/CasE [Oscillospiraceae bacterium]|jgi:CRISPR system Cascade subunit CasE|nr:type I-E CRISPR-associated protein Cas6/Cse3/CasE [Oscillospiraceae bacterium]